jgi:hypothetical protein
LQKALEIYKNDNSGDYPVWFSGNSYGGTIYKGRFNDPEVV